MRINTNMAALNAWRNMSVNEGNTQKALEKLSSGFRINRAADDAAGLAVSEKMRAQIRGTNMAVRNSQDGISLVQTAEGALTETHSILQRMRELGVQASTATLNADDASQVSTEFNQLKSELDRIALNTKFNTKTLLNGEAGVMATASTTSVTNLTGTGDTQVGTGVSLGTALVQATKAQASVNFTAATTTADTSLTINGKSFGFTSGATLATIASTLNNSKSDTGVTASVSGNMLVLDSNTAGSTGTISFSGTGGNSTTDIAAKFGTGNAGGTSTGVTTAGVNAQLTGFADSYTAVGDHVSITSGSLKGLSFDVAGTAATTVSVTSNGALKIQVGAEANQQLGVSIGNMSSGGLGLTTQDVTDQTKAAASITAVDNAIKLVSTQRSSLGAIQNRLEHTVASLQVTAENLQGAESRIRDVDMASEMANFTKSNILQQASQAMLVQANQSTQGVLQMLR